NAINQFQQNLFREVNGINQQLEQTLSGEVNGISFSQREVVTRVDVIADEQHSIVDLLHEFEVLNNAMLKRIEELVMNNDVMQGKLDKQIEVNEQLLAKIAQIEQSQQTVVEHVENNGGLIE